LFPAESLEALPMVLLLALSAALVGAGLIGFRQRDIDSG
jgi:putative exporter of polyketide antibiotics